MIINGKVNKAPKGISFELSKKAGKRKLKVIIKEKVAIVPNKISEYGWRSSGLACHVFLIIITIPEMTKPILTNPKSGISGPLAIFDILPPEYVSAI
ncbi:MAG: hypothetical protein WCW56_01505 [Candidatus Paceibacterota bacterium]